MWHTIMHGGPFYLFIHNHNINNDSKAINHNIKNNSIFRYELEHIKSELY
jgi:hypothetical protein